MKWHYLFFLLLLGALCLIPNSSSIEAENIYLSLEQYDCLAVGCHTDYYVLLNITAGGLNSTLLWYRADVYRGSVSFQSNCSGSLLATDPGQDYNIRGQGGYDMEISEATGYLTVSWLADDIVTVSWDAPVVPFFSLPFILGMVGLGSMFGGSMWFVKKTKEGEYVEAIKVGFVIALLGFALVMAWLWS